MIDETVAVDANPLSIRKTVAEYFAGIGLVRMGLERHGWQIAFANDISEKKYEMYKGFFPEDSLHYVIDDIFDLDPKAVPPTLLATCSFPCIDLSLAGNMTGFAGKHSSAFLGFIQILERQGVNAPPIVLVENVNGWLHSNEGKDFRMTVKALNELGYICDVFALDALRFTPQSRPRVFLIGTRFPTQGGLNETLQRTSDLLPQRLRESLIANADLNWFSLDLPQPPPKHQNGLTKIVENLKDIDPRWWSEHETNRHLAMMESAHRERVEALVSRTSFHYRTFFRRRRKGQQRAEVRDDDLAGCLRTAVGGSGVQFLVRAGRNSIRMRAMTSREYARLQGVPDSCPIGVDGNQALTGFGDAVCVPAISWIAQNVLNPLVEANRHAELLHNTNAGYQIHAAGEMGLRRLWKVNKRGQASFLEKNEQPNLHT